MNIQWQILSHTVTKKKVQRFNVQAVECCACYDMRSELWIQEDSLICRRFENFKHAYTHTHREREWRYYSTDVSTYKFGFLYHILERMMQFKDVYNRA